MKQLSVFLENRPGTLAELTGYLAGKNINLQALSVADTQDFGVVRLITEDSEAALAALMEDGYICKLNDVLAVAVDDKAGALARTLQVLDTIGASVEYLYASLSSTAGRAFLILKVREAEAAREALVKAGIELVEDLR
jgi:hypothetical protein